MSSCHPNHASRISLLVILIAVFIGLEAQNLQLVWQEEFEGSSVDTETWLFESGPTNDNVHYYTSRQENATVSDGKLQIIALKESYQGYEYTSAHIKTEKSISCRYGRIEASIKLPSTRGFVPAFWMLPVDSRYGWWPNSGEIDIMEHPTNEATKIYGTVHTGNYNLFQGPLPPQGGNVIIPDAESAFHLYAIEWTPERIDFFVDDKLYYSFANDHGSSATWPFDQPFYIILNLAVGGGWVGAPDQSTIFPSVMEVDYVRIYQDLSSMEIQGSDFVIYNTGNIVYYLGEIEGATYQWSVPGGATITSGQGSSKITVNWGIFGGDVKAELHTLQDSYQKSFPVRVSANLLKNPGFEKGVKSWVSNLRYPEKGQMQLGTNQAYVGSGSVFTLVEEPAQNAWDVQLSQGDIALGGGIQYKGSFMAKSGSPGKQISAAVINESNFALLTQKTFSPGINWEQFEFDLTPPVALTAAFNIDMGANSGSYYLDDFMLTTPQLAEMNLVRNPDFFNGKDAWTLTTLSQGIAGGEVVEGEYTVSIQNGGSDPWDVHLGQAGLPVEQGYEYTFSFDARAEAPRQITPLIGKNSAPWTIYSEGTPITLSSTRQTFSFTFPMNEPTDLQARMGFDIGGNNSNVNIDNILLRKGKKLSTSVDLLNDSKAFSETLMIYPNPVDNTTSFYFTMLEPAFVTLRIFNINGQEVETLENGFMQEGKHVIRWNAGKHPGGVYLCQLKINGWSETRKLFLR